MSDSDTIYLQSHGIVPDPEPVQPSTEDRVMAWLPCHHCRGPIEHQPDCRYAEKPGLLKRLLES